MAKIKTILNKLAKTAVLFGLAVIVFVGGFITSELLRCDEEPSGIESTNSLQSSQTVNNGISMMAADGSDYVGNTLGQSVPYGALKVTATVEPATAKNKKLTWSFSWSGENASWSSGKDVGDYFKLQTSGANAHEVYVWATAAFGSPVTVTARTVDGSNKTATMTVNFAKRMCGLTEMAMSEEGDCFTFGTFDCSAREFYQGDNFHMKPGPALEDFEYVATYTDGTKSLTWSLVDFRIDYDNEFRDLVEEIFGFETRSSATYSLGEIGYESITHNIWDGADADSAVGSEDSAAKWLELATAMNYAGDVGGLTFYFESASSNALGDKYTYAITFKIVVDYSGDLPVSSVSLSDSSLTM